MALESLNCPVIGPDTRELHVIAEIIPALHAEEALFTWLLGLNAYSVA